MGIGVTRESDAINHWHYWNLSTASTRSVVYNFIVPPGLAENGCNVNARISYKISATDSTGNNGIFTLRMNTYATGNVADNKASTTSSLESTITLALGDHVDANRLVSHWSSEQLAVSSGEYIGSVSFSRESNSTLDTFNNSFDFVGLELFAST
jgi:hypothetical protein